MAGLWRARRADRHSRPGGQQCFWHYSHRAAERKFSVTDPNYSIPAGAASVGAVYLYSPAGTLISTLTGSTANDQVGKGGVTVLANGNYVVVSQEWDNGATTDAGAVTWGSGSTGVSGVVSAANSLVGDIAGDFVGNAGVTALTNGNYVVSSPFWNSSVALRVGAVTWGNGSTGIVGAVSAANSLVGSTANDQVSNPTAFSDGNYVVYSSLWDGIAVDVGAVTPGLGSSGVVGPVAAGNSVLATAFNSGVNLAIGYSATAHQVVVGRPQSNIVSLFSLNRAPQLAPIGNKNAVVGQTLSFSVSATDADGDTPAYSLVGAPAGATITPSTGVFSWTPSAVGSVSFAVRASDVTSFASETILVSVTDSISLSSGPTATPSTAGVGQSVAFSISVASSGALTYAWNIAGTVVTEASPTFAFTAPGVYTINVTVSTAAGTTVKGSVTVTVVAPVRGTGNDSDGDGFSDIFETEFGTDPNNPADSPTGGGPAPAIADLIQAKLRIKLNFAKAVSDSISFSGTLPIAAGFNSANQTATIDVGGAVKTLTLDAKGKSKVFKLGIKSKKGVVAAQTAKYGVKLSQGDFAASLTDEGLTNADATNKAANVAVRIVFGGVIYEHVQAVMYKAKAGKSGAASVAK